MYSTTLLYACHTLWLCSLCCTCVIPYCTTTLMLYKQHTPTFITCSMCAIYPAIHPCPVAVQPLPATLCPYIPPDLPLQHVTDSVLPWQPSANICAFMLALSFLACPPATPACHFHTCHLYPPHGGVPSPYHLHSLGMLKCLPGMAFMQCGPSLSLLILVTHLHRTLRLSSLLPFSGKGLCYYLHYTCYIAL